MSKSEGTSALLLVLVAFVCLSNGQNISYKTYYFEQPVDHFAFVDQDYYRQRYLLNDDYWDSENNGPIFFYTGNEGYIDVFAENTGFMWEIAPEFRAMLVFAEHRYYGESMPYGNASYKPQYLGYLTSEQALADFAELVTYLKWSIPGAGNSPVIAFGGSYGGMLSAWARIKYPHVYSGAIASSAPVLQFTGMTPCGVFNQIVTKDFQDASPACPVTVRQSWDAINNKSETKEGREWLSAAFKTCKPLKTSNDVSLLKDYLIEAYGNLAMINYPYPANFLQPLPAWPVEGACAYMNDSYATDEELLTAVAGAANFYNNYTGQSSCLDVTNPSPNLGGFLWSYQSCSEMIMPMCADGIQDMFEPAPWNLKAVFVDCQITWKVTPRPFMAALTYGGPNISASSNIVFSNGELDPWSGGGVLQSISDSLVAIVISEAAHHLDLRSSNPADPPSVTQARETEKSYIRQWIAESQPAVQIKYPSISDGQHNTRPLHWNNPDTVHPKYSENSV